MKKTVLLVCTGNSCRSQMAEAILNHELSPHVRAVSAGTHPEKEVSPGALEALKQLGIETEDLHPKSIDRILRESREKIDLVVTLCDNAKESCPFIPGVPEYIHFPLPDPFGGPLENFISVRDRIRMELVPLIRKTFEKKVDSE